MKKEFTVYNKDKKLTIKVSSNPEDDKCTICYTTFPSSRNIKRVEDPFEEIYSMHTWDNKISDIVVMCPSTQFYEETVSDYLECFKPIQAGGCIITNEKDQILLMYRKGNWDLPKGKKEPNESNIENAIREVGEETGIKKKDLSDLVFYDKTQHIYFNNDAIIKTTYWYLTTCSSEVKLIPQEIEDIEKLEWIDKDKVLDKVKYGSVKDLLTKYLNGR